MLKGKREVLIISGPCSTESREQILQTAEELMQFCPPDIFRAGVWKARTEVSAYEGAGAESLDWLIEVRNKYNLPLAVEVLSAQHTKLCLEKKIDYLWIGARTVANPYLVKEICNELKGHDVIVMIKNPINPDIRLWTSAINRVKEAGIKNIFAIHRGFSTYSKSPYRNMPLWEIPIELKRLMPEIKIISDPSHICGKTSCIREISQKALDLEMQGLMIESHFDPKNAKSDSNQQLTPKQLKNLLDSLEFRTEAGFEDNLLTNLREEIDCIDDQLLENLSRRLKIVEEIGKIKKEKQITILQSTRFKYLFLDRIRKAKELNLNTDFIREILKAIHNEAIRIQSNILDNKKEN